jgi:hypothetical protein
MFAEPTNPFRSQWTIQGTPRASRPATDKSACGVEGVVLAKALSAGVSAGSGGAAGRDGPLQGLAGSGVADRFRAWKGRSGRRYVFSVFPLDASAGTLDDLPLDGGAVVIGVERRDDGSRWPVFVAESDDAPEALLRSGLVGDLRARRGGELHMHLMAADGVQRRGIVADLAG